MTPQDEAFWKLTTGLVLTIVVALVMIAGLAQCTEWLIDGMRG